MSPVRSRLAACTAALALAVSGVGAATVAPASAAATSARPANTVYVSVGAASYVRMASRVHPGTHRFVITSERSAAYQIVRPARGYTKAEAARDINGLVNGRPAAIRRFERNSTLLGGVSVDRGHQGIMWAHLSRGTYWALDTDPGVIRAAKIRTFYVSGSTQTSTAPHAESVILAVHEHDWAPYPPSISHSGVLSFRNDSEDVHFIAMAKLLPGKTIADFKAWLDAVVAGDENAGDPPIDENVTLDSSAVSPEHGMSMRYSAPPGDYVLACFWPDADMGGMPHAFMGMYRGITLR